MATARTQRVKDHQVWADLNSLDQALEQAEVLLPGSDPDIGPAFLSLQGLAKHTRTVLKSMNPLITPVEQLDAVDTALQSVASSVASANSYVDGSELLTAWTQANALLTALSTLPVVRSRHDATAMTEAIAQVQQQSGEALEALSEQTERIGTEVAAVEARQSALSSEITEQQGSAIQALIQLESSVQRAIEEFEHQLASMRETQDAKIAAAFAVVEGRLATAETKADNFYSSDETRHLSQMEKFQEDFDGARETFDQQTAATEQAYAESADQLIASLQAKLEEGQSLVGMISEVVMTGHYQRNAAEQKKAADLWTIWTVVATALAVGWAVGLTVYGLWHPTDHNWFDYVSRIGVGAALAALAGYLGVQARNHRKREIHYRDLELELATLDPFLGSLEDEERQKVKTKLAYRYFSGKNPDAATVE